MQCRLIWMVTYIAGMTKNVQSVINWTQTQNQMRLDSYLNLNSKTLELRPRPEFEWQRRQDF